MKPPPNRLANNDSIFEMYGRATWQAVDPRYAHGARRDLGNSLPAGWFPASAVNIDDLFMPA
jgi:hypothetical protein